MRATDAEGAGTDDEGADELQRVRGTDAEGAENSQNRVRRPADPGHAFYSASDGDIPRVYRYNPIPGTTFMELTMDDGH